MEYVMGIDGGASSTTCALADTKGRVLSLGRGGPSNHAYGEEGKKRLKDALSDSISNCLKTAGVKPRLSSAVLGMTGIHEGTPQSELAARYVADIVHAEVIRVYNDAKIALVGALGRSRGTGIMVYSGTGSVAYGMNDDGHMQKAGGWGHIIDDGGSGYDIGRMALRAAFMAYDGRAPETTLLEALKRHFGCTRPEDIIPKVYGGSGLSRPQIAALSRIVSKQAVGGDEVAISILHTAGELLSQLVIAVAKKLGISDQHVPVFAVGGVFNAGRFILAPLMNSIRSAIPRAEFETPTLPPVAGALLLALEITGVKSDVSIINSLKEGVGDV
jgi:N-acetylglucosamine kinase